MFIIPYSAIKIKSNESMAINLLMQAFPAYFSNDGGKVDMFSYI